MSMSSADTPRLPGPTGTPQPADVRDWLRQARDAPPAQVVEVLQLDQLRRWREGERVPAEAYLQLLFGTRPAGGRPEPDGEHALELVYGEFLLRRQSGEAPTLQEFQWRFPQYGEQLRLLCELERHLEQTAGGPPADCPPAALPARWPPVPGYEITGELGRGGMAIVYKARQASLQRWVALKMLRSEIGAEDAALARFEREGQALAALQHPHVVQIHEVGQYDGRPYVALEYLDGGTLAAASAATPQPPQAAARLVTTLARAVHGAHERGVVHRDLKPANVLLTADGTPKIADFGLARLVGAGQTGQTPTGAVLGTPGYMAPEQATATGDEVGVPADVYALGAILYELLTGRAPFVGETPLETLQLVCTQDPLSPGRLRPGLPRDLETICLHCLHKEPGKRYRSARLLAEDLERFLAGEPIRARPVSTWERALKWARRRPAAAALVAVSGTALVVVATLIVVSNTRLREQRNLAEAKRAEASAQRGRALALLRTARDAVERMTAAPDRLAPAPYTLTVRRQLLEDAVRLYQELARQEDNDPEIRYEVGRAWRRLGKIQDSLERREQAAQSCRHAVLVFEQLTTEAPDQPAYWFELAASCNNLSMVLDANQLPEKERLLRRALALQDRLAAEHPETAAYHLDASVTRGDLGNALGRMKRLPEALQAWQEGIDGLEKLLADVPSSIDCRFALGNVLNSRGAFLARVGRFQEAVPSVRRAVEVFEPLAAHPAAQPRHRFVLALSWSNLGQLLVETGSPGEAEPVFRRAVEVGRKLASDYPEVTTYHAELGKTLHYLAIRVRERGDLAAAILCWNEAIEHYGIARKADPDDPEVRRMFGFPCRALADARLRRGEYREAERTAAELPSLWPDRGAGDFEAALLVSRCVPAVAKDAQLSPAQREELTTRYAGSALALLRQAIQKGNADVAARSKDVAFDPLRSRPEFQQLLSDATRKPRTDANIRRDKQ
jgi:serine/threonine-protein kinase